MRGDHPWFLIANEDDNIGSLTLVSSKRKSDHNLMSNNVVYKTRTSFTIFSLTNWNMFNSFWVVFYTIKCLRITKCTTILWIENQVNNKWKVIGRNVSKTW